MFQDRASQVVDQAAAAEYYRVTTPISNPLKCIVLMEDKRKLEMVVADISIAE